MNIERWLLPEGVEEILPAEARGVELLRRRLLDLYECWGYELVMPPLLEFTDSLLSGVGSDLDLQTLKVTDQLTGRMMGLRADITPQAARIDAHSYVREGVTRLCYSDHVLQAKPRSPLKVRTPIQSGVELFGESGLDADIEVISLLLESLIQVGTENITLDLGHVGIFRDLISMAKISDEEEIELLELLKTKDMEDIHLWLEAHISDQDLVRILRLMPDLRGGPEILEEAKQQLEGAPAEVFAAIDELCAVSDLIAQRYPQVNVYLDLSELQGYHYHTGLVFAAYIQSYGDAIANGGRYDHVGESFGRARPATGFAINLTSTLSLLSLPQSRLSIYAPATDDAEQWAAIQDLRANNERVICGLSAEDDMSALGCDRHLVLEEGQYRVKSL